MCCVMKTSLIYIWTKSWVFNANLANQKSTIFRPNPTNKSYTNLSASNPTPNPKVRSHHLFLIHYYLKHKKKRILKKTLKKNSSHDQRCKLPNFVRIWSPSKLMNQNNQSLASSFGIKISLKKSTFFKSWLVHLIYKLRTNNWVKLSLLKT